MNMRPILMKVPLECVEPVTFTDAINNVRQAGIFLRSQEGRLERSIEAVLQRLYGLMNLEDLLNRMGGETTVLEEARAFRAARFIHEGGAHGRGDAPAGE